MHKTITPSKIPKTIGLSVGLILSILFLPGDIAYAAGTRTVEPKRPERPAETRKEYYGDPRKSKEINKKIQETYGIRKFGLGPEKEKEKESLKEIGNKIKQPPIGEPKEWKLERRQQRSLLRKTPRSKSISKEVSRKFESLSIEEICEAPQLLPSSVESVQRLLNDLTGSELKVDGQLGPLTRKAIRQFQLLRGISMTGTVDTQTARQLMAETVIPGETMFHIAVSSDSGECRITRSSDHQTPARGNFKDMTLVGSLEDLLAYVGDGPSKLSRTEDELRFLFISGRDLRVEWKSDLEARSFRTVRISDQSPKKFLKEYDLAAKLPYQAVPSRTEILSALPRAGSESEMRMKLRAMNLPEVEMSRWLGFTRKLDDAETEYRKKFSDNKELFKERSKQEVLEALSGDSDIIFLIGHLEKGDIHLSTGEMISGIEIEGLNRKSTEQRRRLVIVIGCGAGALNQEVKSLGQHLIDKNLADLLIAPTGLFSAEGVVRKFQEWWFEEKPFPDVLGPEEFLWMGQFHPHFNVLMRAMNSDSWTSNGAGLTIEPG